MLWVVPKGALTPDEREQLLAHKAELLALLSNRDRMTRTDPLEDGCQLHAVAAENVSLRWSRVRDNAVAVCVCCAGPTASPGLVCARCSVDTRATSEIEGR